MFVCVSAPMSGCEREYFSVGYLDILHKALNNLCNAGPLSLPFNFSRLGWVVVVRAGLSKADLGKLSINSVLPNGTRAHLLKGLGKHGSM